MRHAVLEDDCFAVYAEEGGVSTASRRLALGAPWRLRAAARSCARTVIISTASDITPCRAASGDGHGHRDLLLLPREGCLPDRGAGEQAGIQGCEPGEAAARGV